MKMRKVLIGYLLLWAVLITMTLLATPAAAVGLEDAMWDEITCQRWGASWRNDKNDLRSLLREAWAFDNSETDPDVRAFGLCLLMNVDYFINTVLGTCDAGLPIDVGGPAVLQALSDRCAT